MRLNKKVAIVTGGGVGIGKAISLAFAAEGAAVVVASRNQPRLESVADEIRAKGGKATAIPTDISDENQVEKMVTQALNEYGQIDILVNNSGIAGPTVNATDIKLEDWNEVLAVNLTGAMLCTREALKDMLARQSGNIINISSAAGTRGLLMRSPYCATKWGLIGFGVALALEVGRYNIHVNCIAPGAVEGERIMNVMKAKAEATGLTYEEIASEMSADAALKRMVTPAEIADAAVFLASDESNGITGQTISVNAGRQLKA